MVFSLFQQKRTTVGDYAVVEKIGRGATGDVYKATDPKSQDFVAVKILAKDLADHPILLKRFEREFEIARSLQHPNIVRALNYGIDNGIPYMVMEFVEGETLWQTIRSAGGLPVSKAMEFIAPIGEALQAAHDRGLIHRDVKPDNILIDQHGHPKLADFGLVKVLQNTFQLTESATTLRTPHFMAPEQFQDSKRVDHRCDIYGLAATLYMAVTGALPFDARGHLSILKKKLLNDLIPPYQLNSNLPFAFESQLLRAMRINREERHNSCAEFLAALAQADGASEEVASEALPKRALCSDERREATRFTCSFEGDCASFLHRRGEEWQGRVINVSLGGLALVLPRRLEPKHVLRVILPFGEPLGDQAVYVRVANVSPCLGGWRIGCQFAYQLGADDLQLLVDELAHHAEWKFKVQHIRKAAKQT